MKMMMKILFILSSNPKPKQRCARARGQRRVAAQRICEETQLLRRQIPVALCGVTVGSQREKPKCSERFEGEIVNKLI